MAGYAGGGEAVGDLLGAVVEEDRDVVIVAEMARRGEGACLFLASEESAWITGVNLPVDGGFLAR